jgi:hypothetical protein
MRLLVLLQNVVKIPAAAFLRSAPAMWCESVNKDPPFAQVEACPSGNKGDPSFYLVADFIKFFSKISRSSKFVLF